MKNMDTTMIKKKHKRAFALAISLVVVFSITAGCGNNSNKQTNTSVNDTVYNEGTSNNNSTGGTTTPEGTDPDATAPAPTDPAPPATDDKTEPTTKPTTSSEKQGSGTYVGQADSNSIEIKTKEGATSVFQVDDKMSEKLSQIDDDSAITYTYIEKELNDGNQKIKQLWLTSIKVVK